MESSGARILITGTDAVSRFGRGADALWRGVTEQPHAARPEPTPRDAKASTERTASLAADAAAQAMEDAALFSSGAAAVCFASELLTEDAARDAAAGVGRASGTSRVFVFSGEAAGRRALAAAIDLLRRGEAGSVIAVGADVPGSGAAPAGVRVSSAAARPFEYRRDGVVPAEGAAALVLEDEEQARQRGARVRAAILGAASAPGRGIAAALTSALIEAHLAPPDISWVCTAAAGDPDLDIVEEEDIARVWAPEYQSIPISSVHGALGYTFAGAPFLGVVAATRALAAGQIPPTAGYNRPNAAFADIDVVCAIPRNARLARVIVDAIDNGGCLSLVLQRG